MKLGDKLTRMLLKKLQNKLKHTITNDLGFQSVEDFVKFINLRKNNREFYSLKKFEKFEKFDTLEIKIQTFKITWIT